MAEMRAELRSARTTQNSPSPLRTLRRPGAGGAVTLAASYPLEADSAPQEALRPDEQHGDHDREHDRRREGRVRGGERDLEEDLERSEQEAPHGRAAEASQAADDRRDEPLEQRREAVVVADLAQGAEEEERRDAGEEPRHDEGGRD